MQDSEAVRTGVDEIPDDVCDGWLTKNRDSWSQNRKFEGDFVEV